MDFQTKQFMNKALFQKVKALCKDTGLSEKYLEAITDKLGGSIKDDSTDEEAITSQANLVAEVAKASQSEATRWANKAKEGLVKPKDTDTHEGDDDDDDKTKKKPRKDGEQSDDPRYEALLKAVNGLTERFDNLDKQKKNDDRSALISKAMETHKIPKKFRAALAKAIPDDADIEETVKGFKQDFITEGLAPEESGNKAASDAQIDEAADELLDSVTVK